MISVSISSFWKKEFIQSVFSLKLARNIRFKPKTNFDFKLIVSFEDNFWIFKSYKNVLQDVYGVFFFRSKYDGNAFFLVWNKLAWFSSD
jgi:hypothetical protein